MAGLDHRGQPRGSSSSTGRGGGAVATIVGRDRRRDGDLPSDALAHAHAGPTRSSGTRSPTTSTTSRTGSRPESAKTHPNFAYRLIHWISSGLDALVRWLYHLLSTLAHVARHDAASAALLALALRRPSRRGDHGRELRVVRRARPLGRQHADARADARRRRALAARRRTARHRRRPLRPVQRAASRPCSTRCRSFPRSRT